MTLDKALEGIVIPQDIKNTLVLLDIDHVSINGLLQKGQLIVHHKVANELQNIFKELLKIQFPIEKMIPVSYYNWSDDASMADNNTSAFNYRFIYGTDRLSNHSYGLALDINPFLNPYHAPDGKVFPYKAKYNPDIAGTLKENEEVVMIFKMHGWEWGGAWEHKDWQHFQKIL